MAEFTSYSHLQRAEKIITDVAQEQWLEKQEQREPTGPDFSAAVARENRLLALAHAHIALANALNAESQAHPNRVSG